jgi:signal transduction histidine kinase
MDRWLGRRLGWAALAVSAAMVLAALGLLALDGPAGGAPLVAGALLPALLALSYPAVGAVLVTRLPRNPIGWLFCAFGLTIAVTMLGGEYAVRGLVTAPGSLPGAVFAAWLQSWLLAWMFAAGFPLLFLVFPDGRLPSPRWRPMLWLVGLLLVIQQAIAMLPRTRLGAELRGVDLRVPNPTGVYDADLLAHGPLMPLGPALDVLFLSVIGACGAALLVRLRRSRGVERQQIKWLVYVCTLLVAGLVVYLAAQAAGLRSVQLAVFYLVVIGATLALPVAAAFAILRYRLYGIDVVISRTLLVGAMAAFITAVYAAIVVGLGSLVGLGGRTALPLSLLATAVTAVAFEPVRERVQGLANRLVYGRRASPYEVLSRFGQLAAAQGAEEILPRTARVFAESVGAAGAELWIRLDSRLVLAAAWPAPAAAAADVPGGARDSPASGTRLSVPIRQRSELLGSVALAMPAGHELGPAALDLLNDLAAQAAVVLGNLLLTAALRARLDEISRQEAELRRSRQRLVAAQDAERRRLERDIHDGAQQHLVALAVRLRLAGSLAVRNPDRALGLARGLRDETGQALATLRELTGGIYPPLLAERGLGPALRARAEGMTLPVRVIERGGGRAAPPAELAVYLCCLEALQNAAKHSAAAGVTIHLETDERELRFTVSDDGVGFDQAAAGRGTGLSGMRDRAEAVGGRLQVTAAPGAGVTVSGAVPLRTAEVPA